MTSPRFRWYEDLALLFIALAVIVASAFAVWADDRQRDARRKDVSVRVCWQEPYDEGCVTVTAPPSPYLTPTTAPVAPVKATPRAVPRVSPHASRFRVERDTLNAIRYCESRGNYKAVSAGGTYRGAYQFDRSTWASYGPPGDPASASKAEQDRRALALLRARGVQPWPVCGRYALTKVSKK